MAKSEIFTGENSIFACRLKKMMNNQGITQLQLAKELNMTRQAVSLYLTGQALPAIDKLLIICEYFNVSSDYLLGLTDASTNNAELRAVCEYTGLTEDSLTVLKWLTEDSQYKHIINFILPHNNFTYVLLQMVLYTRKMKNAVNLQNAINLKKVYEDNSETDMAKLLLADEYYEKARYHLFETLEKFKKMVEDYNIHEDKYWENHRKIYADSNTASLPLLDLVKQDDFFEDDVCNTIVNNEGDSECPQ